MSILELEKVSYAYEKDKFVLKDISIALETGKMYAVLGASGAGKTTLLSLLGGLDLPTQGRILFQGEDIAANGLEMHRHRNVSLIFQNYNLIDYMTPLENVNLTAKLEAAPILEKLGLKKDEITRSVLKLSGGQQQRVAVVRSLACDAPVILADEPTGNLDEKNAVEITNILRQNAHQYGKCIIVITHSKEVAAKADTVLNITGGYLK